MAKILLSMLVLVIMTGPASSNSQASANAPRSAQKGLFPFLYNMPFTPQNRVEFVRLSNAFCREVLDTVPTNTPAEEAWVVTEAKTTDINRISRLLSSKEWARHQLKETFSDCLQKLSLLQQAQANSSRSAEALQFISLAFTFNDSTDLGAFAKRVDLKSDFSPIMSLLRQSLMIAAMRTLDGRDDPPFSQPGEQQRK